jgi:hypothetical protein
MAGGFALGETDPARGNAAGTAAGTRLALRLSLTIPDIDRFVSDPSHSGTLEGTVTFGPLGTDLRASAGLFQLFAPTDDPSLKLMNYRVTFEHDGRRFCLDGSKQVRRGSPLGGWTATTTLLCRLYSGNEPAGPVIGAGVLRLSPAQFAGQLLSFRAVNGRAIGSKTRALAGFFTFFARELIDTYVRWPS